MPGLTWGPTPIAPLVLTPSQRWGKHEREPGRDNDHNPNSNNAKNSQRHRTEEGKEGTPLITVRSEGSKMKSGHHLQPA